MPNRDNRQTRARTVENLTDLLCRSQQRFGELLREVCEVSGFTQGKLSREAKAERQRLIASGYIHSKSSIGSMEQPTISKVMAGVQEPTYLQVFIWLRVIRSHYESARFAEICQKLNIPVPEFPPELERKLWHLSTFMPPEDLLKAYEESKDEKPTELSPSLIEHKETRWEPRKELRERITEGDLAVVEHFKENTKQTVKQ
jgi:hypothetical protein